MDIKLLLEALGEGKKTIDEVIEAINESQKDTVPYARFNEKVQEVNKLKKEVKTRDEQLQTLGTQAQGNEELTNTINQLKQENQTAKEQYEAEIAGLKFNSALDKTLLTAKARNPKAVKALLDMETIKLDGDSLLGVSEQLEKLQETDSYLFDVQQQQQDPGGYNPGSGQKTNPQPGQGEEGYEAARARARELMGRK
ncbi:phage scaffolding protein [Priestia megaterium]|uniref:phage scaffolding protein n=1 Tax=Priestia megaterium TaxID=1404 RepID=UPI002E1F2392|nr:phage scaffolding protein [Priestia megaterium]